MESKTDRFKIEKKLIDLDRPAFSTVSTPKVPFDCLKIYSTPPLTAVSTLKVPFDRLEIYSTPPLIAVSTLKVLTAKSKNQK